MRRSLVRYLMNVHRLVRSNQRQRGARPGVYLEEDLEHLARDVWLRTERRVRRAPHGGLYYSGLAPETDLFVYDGPQFLHVEAKDVAGGVGRAVPTEFWARALDLHLGRICVTLPDAPYDHYPVLVVTTDASYQVRAACMRWSICLLEPSCIPIHALASIDADVSDYLQRAGCTEEDLRWASLPFNRRYPRNEHGILVPWGQLRMRSSADAILRFQRLASKALLGMNSASAQTA